MLNKVQSELNIWVSNNFGDRPAYHPLLGIGEELGELNHAFLKKEQGIRTNEDHDSAMVDAVGDILIYLLDFCNAMGYNANNILETTWGKVKQRDWVNSPTNGVKEEIT